MNLRDIGPISVNEVYFRTWQHRYIAALLFDKAAKLFLHEVLVIRAIL